MNANMFKGKFQGLSNIIAGSIDPLPPGKYPICWRTPYDPVGNPILNMTNAL